MSPASKFNSRDKKAGKESQKASSKPSVTANAGNGVPASVYNPFSGSFHFLETGQISSTSSLNVNSRFRNIDETDDNHGSVGSGVEYDSVSNNGSWSGDSEDHKEKTLNPSVRQETTLGPDNDKREKIRLMNERKHQRHKEKRAQELLERCSGYLMSRKLEALAQQLVAMGFSHEHAMMALILNEGKVEESISWLFEGGEADKPMDPSLGGSNLKIDISEELDRIAEMQIRHKCTKQEVERAVIACEGDIDKAAESLRSLKSDPCFTQPKPEETGDRPIAINGKLPVAASENALRSQSKSTSPPIPQQRRDEKDFNYMKTSLSALGSSGTGTKNMLTLKRVQQKLEWAKPQQTAGASEKRWPSAGSNPLISYPLASPSQVNPPPSGSERHYLPVGAEYKNFQNGTLREPVIVMQRPQSVNMKQVPATSLSSSPPGTAAGWYPTNSVDIMKSNCMVHQIPSSKHLGPTIPSSSQMFHHHNYQQQHLVPTSTLGDYPNTSRGTSLWGRNGGSPTLAVASSLGLFSGLGANGSSGPSLPVDWSTAGSMSQFDYTNIDWSLDRSRTSPRPNGFWIGSDSSMNNSRAHDTSNSNLGTKLTIRSAPTMNGLPILALHEGGLSNAEKSIAGSREWNSPFEGNDFFTLPRQFVSSPSL